MSHSFVPGTAGVYDAAELKQFVETLPTEEEQHHSMISLLNLRNLSSYVNDYASAVGLHRHVQDLRESVLRTNEPNTLVFNNHMHLLKNWDEMAGREAAMTLFHVGKALLHIKTNMHRTETIKAESVSENLRKASGELERAFPNYNVARHAAGHRAEAVGSLEKVKLHAVDIEGGQQFIIGNVQGDDYVATFEKKLLKVPLTEEARQRLNDVVALIYSAFPKLVHMLPPLNFGVPVTKDTEVSSENLSA
jgi:hypothetical protein